MYMELHIEKSTKTVYIFFEKKPQWKNCLWKNVLRFKNTAHITKGGPIAELANISEITPN